VRLYQKGLKLLEEKERIIKQKKEEVEKIEESELKFRPQIITTQRQNANEQIGKKEEELIRYGRMLNEKKEMARVINN
jgi:hypothetical protein